MVGHVTAKALVAHELHMLSYYAEFDVDTAIALNWYEKAEALNHTNTW